MLCVKAPHQYGDSYLELWSCHNYSQCCEKTSVTGDVSLIICLDTLQHI